MQKVRKVEDIEKLKDDKEVYVSVKLSKRLITKILLKVPSLRIIYVPNSILRYSDKSLITALKSIGVDVLPTRRGRGRPSKYNEEIVKSILERYVNGERVSDISHDTGVPLRTVYHIIRRERLRRKAS